MKSISLFIITFLFISQSLVAQTHKMIAPTPPMGWMSWNIYGKEINETLIKKNVDAMVSQGLAKVGFEYICIDDGWVGGRDKYNNLIGDAEKFPSGIKALADYIHSKGLKFGIYSSAGQLTCEQYNGSRYFEAQDAKRFAEWGVDYLKYDFCDTPVDDSTAYIAFADAISKGIKESGRPIFLSLGAYDKKIFPWLWAARYAQSWRIGYDMRDKWKTDGFSWDKNGIINAMEHCVELYQYAGPGHWNDPDMLNVGLYGKGTASSLWGNTGGCTTIEYQSNMSLWCLMAAPLLLSCELADLSEESKRILLNKEIIDINQDVLGKACERKIKNSVWNVFVKPLTNGDYAVGILNLSNTTQVYRLNFANIGLNNKYAIRDIWQHKVVGNKKNQWSGKVQSHETIVLRLSQSNK
jgi:alpha-galactosidase